MAAEAEKAEEPRDDPSGVGPAIDRYRDLAKYLITIFAAVGAVLAAGTQLASIGKLSLEEAPERVLAVVLGLALAIAAIAGVVQRALRVLIPVEMSLDQVAADPVLTAKLDARSSILGGAGSVQRLRELLATDVLSEEDRAEWLQVVDDVLARAAFLRMEATFEAAWRGLLVWATIGVLGITAFAWGANPPEDDSPDPIVRPAPVSVQLSLTEDGRAALSDAVGGGACARRPMTALVIGGTEERPRVVTLPHRSCKPAQFVLDPEWGAITPSE